MTYVVLYHKFSKGGRALAKELKYKTTTTQQIPAAGINLEGVVVNWGCATWPKTAVAKVLNGASSVKTAGNKLKLFQLLEGSVRIPEYTSDIDTALKWLNEGHQVLGRKTNSSSGKDIAFFDEDPERFSNSQFWTKYKKKKLEFRVHVMGGSVLFIQKKVLRTHDEAGNPIDKKDVDFRIRNLANGFLFQKHDFETPKDVISQALDAVKYANLDFGAVDVIYNDYEQKAYVLEINTAPGLDGTSPQVYSEGLKKLIAAA